MSPLILSYSSHMPGCLEHESHMLSRQRHIDACCLTPGCSLWCHNSLLCLNCGCAFPYLNLCPCPQSQLLFVKKSVSCAQAKTEIYLVQSEGLQDFLVVIKMTGAYFFNKSNATAQCRAFYFAGGNGPTHAVRDHTLTQTHTHMHGGWLLKETWHGLSVSAQTLMRQHTRKLRSQWM